DATVTGKDGTVKAHSTTAADLARIMSYCITDSPQKEAFLEITGTPSYTFTSYQEKDGEYVSSGRTFSCTNHNAFLTMMDGALSGKTGFTGNAGYCYVGALKRDDRTFVVALLACGWPNNKSYKWSDTKALMNYGLENFEYHSLNEVLYDSSQLTPIPVLGGQTKKLGDQAYTKVEIRRPDLTAANSLNGSDGLLLKKDEEIQVDFHIESQLTAPVSAGTEVGRISYLVDNTPYRVEYILTCEDIPAIDYSWCIRQILRYFCI
ncbi:MAG: D-alanyl-D-alanine carboxypeptidase, partial [Bacillota bacterium]|nr:D-alanyl-D-alanine carboxypeptidase [Bacillota bacterium]